MPSRKKNIEIDLIVDDRQKSKLRGIGDQAATTGGRFSNLAGGVKAAALGVGALVGTKIISFLSDAAQAAAEDQKAQELLALAIQNSTDATNTDIDKMEDWIKKVSLATGVADDELRPALAELARTTGDLETAQDTLGIAMDIAAAKGIPLETVTKGIGKAALGNIGALGRLGIATRNAEGDTLTFEEAMAEASRTMGGASATAADTAAGKMAILKVRMDEAKESIGNVLIPVLADGAEAMNNIGLAVDFFAEKLEGLPGPTGNIVDTVKDLAGPFGLLNWATGLLAEEIQKVIDAEEDLVGPLEVSRDRYDEMSRAVDDNTSALQDNADELRAQMDPMFNLIQKTNDLETAQINSGKARDEYGKGSPQHLEALRKEAEAWLTFKDAQAKAAHESGITRETYRKNLEAMGILTRDEIDLMVKEFDKLDGRTVDVTIQVNRRGDIINDRSMPHFAAGGVVPGPTGSAQLAVVHGGEEVLTPAQRNGHSGGDISIGPIYAGMGANGGQIGQQIVEAIRQYEKRNGRGWRS